MGGNGAMGVFRLLLAVSVFLSHTRNFTGLPFLGGDEAVEVFFVISGFYMQLVLERRYTRAALGPRWVWRFYAARYLRLYPAYAAVVAVTVAGCLIGKFSDPVQTLLILARLKMTSSNLAGEAFIVLTNATMLFQEGAYYLSVHDGAIQVTTDFRASDFPVYLGLGAPQGWSLGIEIAFYILAPWLLNLRSLWIVVIGAMILGLKFYLWPKVPLDDPFTYRFFPFELGYFLAGALAFRTRRYLGLSFLPTRLRYLLAACVVQAVVFKLVPALPDHTDVFVATLGLPVIFGATAKLGWDRAIGELSYPFYISHWLAILLVRGWVNPHAALYTTFALAALILVAEQVVVEPWRERIAGTDREPAARSGDLRRLLSRRLIGRGSRLVRPVVAPPPP